MFCKCSIWRLHLSGNPWFCFSWRLGRQYLSRPQTGSFYNTYEDIDAIPQSPSIFHRGFESRVKLIPLKHESTHSNSQVDLVDNVLDMGILQSCQEATNSLWSFTRWCHSSIMCSAIIKFRYNWTWIGHTNIVFSRRRSWNDKLYYFWFSTSCD